MEVKTVGLASDHAGFPMKQFVLQYLEKKGYPVKDYGTYSDESVDYPDFAHALAEGIENGDVYPGIGICGSGEAMAMTLNKHQGVRAGLAWNKDIAQLIRQHNDANVIVLPGRLDSTNTARLSSTSSSKLPLRVAVTSVASEDTSAEITSEQRNEFRK